MTSSPWSHKKADLIAEIRADLKFLNGTKDSRFTLQRLCNLIENETDVVIYPGDLSKFIANKINLLTKQGFSSIKAVREAVRQTRQEYEQEIQGVAPVVPKGPFDGGPK